MQRLAQTLTTALLLAPPFFTNFSLLLLAPCQFMPNTRLLPFSPFKYMSPQNPISALDVPSAAGVGPALPAHTLRLDVGVRNLASQGWLQQTRKNVKLVMSGKQGASGWGGRRGEEMLVWREML